MVGEVGDPDRRPGARSSAAQGFPPGSLTGISGLELAWNERLSGRPGGQLVAASAVEESEFGGGRVLATSEPVPGKAVRTTIDPALQEAAVSALGDLFGGVAVLDARKGDVLALAGIAYSAPQPPGSTFKVITTTAALDAGIVKLADEFPVEVSNSAIGREIANAHDSPCGGTFAESFANSCNTVFAPLGAELGGEQLVETAELFGFNQPPELFDPEAAAAIDPPREHDPGATSSASVEVGESAIGQGQVLATPLQMASVAQTIANRGARLPTPIARTRRAAPAGEPVEVTSKQTAATVRDLMIGVVELRAPASRRRSPGSRSPARPAPPSSARRRSSPATSWSPGWSRRRSSTPGSPPSPRPATRSWRSRCMIVDSEGDGGEIAAPIAAQVLATGLGASLDVEDHLAQLPVALDLEVQRAVLADRVVDREDQQRALIGPVCAVVSGSGSSPSAGTGAPISSAYGLSLSSGSYSFSSVSLTT